MTQEIMLAEISDLLKILIQKTDEQTEAFREWQRITKLVNEDQRMRSQAVFEMLIPIMQQQNVQNSGG